MDTEQHL